MSDYEQTERTRVYRKPGRGSHDRDLVHSVLGQLVHARGGAEPLLATLDAYFAAGAVATEAARRLTLKASLWTIGPGRSTSL